MKFLAVLAAVLFAASAPALAAPAAKPKAKPVAPTRVVLPTTVRPDRYDIHITPDSAGLKFTGHVDIDLTVLKPTDRIVLNAADLKFGKASLSGAAGAPRIVLDDKEQTAAFVFTAPLGLGKHRLSIDYSGVIYEQASGMFALDYEAQGAKKRALFTQFENSDARRFAPMWDEPGVKSVFALSVDAPAGQMAVSNMPVAETRALPGGGQFVRFADSPKMSSYLLFFALGEFERVHQMVGPTDVGVVVRKGDAEKARFALDAAVKLLPYYNAYFDTPYPLPKLDLVAGPGRSQFFSAMENWGAIFYFDYAILLDANSTEADKQNVFVTIAHEMAHQWFGDLVTMEWWDNLWLNEGFASWMENKATDHFHPEWNIWLSTQSGQQSAMRLDARSGTHPIITHIPDVFAAANAFDGITYQKGQAVIRMLEAYVGEDAFRAGVRSYIKAHAYGNTVSDDLWRELDKASTRKVTAMAHDFTLQAGVPLIRAAPMSGGVRLTQSRFAAEPSQQTPRTWRTPVIVEGVAQPLIVSAAAPVTAPTGGQAAPVINAGQTGYFRTAYAPELWAKLAPRYPQLPPADQLGLLFDSRALGEAGVVPMSDFLDLAKAAPPTGDPVVLETLTDQLAGLDWLFGKRPTQTAYRAFVISRLTPIARRIGWDPKPGESDNEAVLRRSLLGTLGALHDPATVAEARRRFDRYLADRQSLTGAGRRTVLSIVAANADAATWEALLKLARESTDVTDRTRLLSLLGQAEDPALVQRALKLALSGEISKTDAPSLIAAVSGEHPDEAYDFAIANRAQVDALLEPTSRTTYYSRLASASRDPAMLRKLDALAPNVPASSRGELEKAAAAIRVRLEIIAKRVPQMEAWLAKNS